MCFISHSKRCVLDLSTENLEHDHVGLDDYLGRDQCPY